MNPPIHPVRIVLRSIAAIAFSLLFTIPFLAGNADAGSSINAQPACSTAEPVASRPVLQKGLYGKKTQYLQKLVGDPGNDGCFDKQLDDLVRKYQRSKSLEADGIVGKQTWSYLLGDTATTSVTTPPAAQAAAAPTTTVPYTAPVISENGRPDTCGSYKCAVIDQGKNQVRLYYANGSLYDKGPMIDNPAKLSKGLKWIGDKVKENTIHDGKLVVNYWQQFAGDKAFHTIPVYTSNGQAFHSEDILGTDAKTSDGCIRLGQAFAAEFFDFSFVGMPVVTI